MVWVQGDAPAAAEVSPRGKSKKRCAICTAFCCCTFLMVAFVLVGVWLYVVDEVADIALSDFLYVPYEKTNFNCHVDLTPATLPRNSWYPGCGYTDESIGNGSNFSCLEPCFATEFQRMEDFNLNNPAELVSYSSRAHGGIETKTLTGWLFKAPANASGVPASRVVVQHGFRSTSNKFRAQVMAYMLRSMGFTVLVNNLRDHCYSENTTEQIVGWGHAYPYDVLGAWDYLVNDPDGKLGGNVSSSHVGLLGFSMGGFLSSIAFALEPGVPGVWIDGAPVRPEDSFFFNAEKRLQDMGLGAVSDQLLEAAWSDVVDTAKESGIDLAGNLPAEVLPRAPDTARAVMWWHNSDDGTVSIKDGREHLSIFKTYPAKFKVSEYETSGRCNGDNHCVDHLRLFDQYSAMLCRFLVDALDAPHMGCPA